MRYLLIVLLLPLFVAPVYAQSATATPTAMPTATPTSDPNPRKETCGLPASGIIKVSVIYTLTANCTQTGTLQIRTANTPSVTLTINGAGFTISNGASASPPNRMNFLIVDDQGDFTIYNRDTSPSPNVKVVIKNVTFDGLGKRFARPLCADDDGELGVCSVGSWISTEGTLEMENVTFTNGYGIWLRAEGTASLTSVLFKDSKQDSTGIRADSAKGVLHVTETGRVTMHNAVFRNIARSVIEVWRGGRLTTTGCLRFQRTHTHNVFSSRLHSSLGTWSNSSSPDDCPAEIGNGGSPTDSYSPTLLPCGFPASGYFGGGDYTLNQDCVCVQELLLVPDTSVTINGNGHRIEGCSTGIRRIRMGGFSSLTINNTVIVGVQIWNYGGDLIIRDSTISDTLQRPIINHGNAYVSATTFRNNQGHTSLLDSAGSVYTGSDLYRMGRATFRNNMYSGNTIGPAELVTDGPGTSIDICGESQRSDPPVGDTVIAPRPLAVAINGGLIIRCGESQAAPPPPAPPAPGCPPAQPAMPEKRLLGAIGVILYVELCPPAIEIWEILPDSQGQFALRVSQADIEAMQEGDIVCSANGRAAVRIGLTEPVREIMAYSKSYTPPTERGGRDILVSLGPNYEQKVHHVVIDHALDGKVMCTVDTRPAEAPCEGAGAVSQIIVPAALAPPPQSILHNCMVTINYIVNFRETPGGAFLHFVDPWGSQIAGWLPQDVTLTAFERTDQWFKVDYYGARGWVHADYVSPQGDCG